MDQKAGISFSAKTNKTQNLRYKKKSGTAGVGGQLYESKLLSLILFRALEDKNIVDFQLGANICIGDFDDICFKCNLKEQDTTKVVFVQAKHKENRSQSSSFNFLSYYDSYIKLKNHFRTHHEDIIFDGLWTERDCYLVFYTPSKNIINDKYKITCSVPWLEELICARKTVGGNNLYKVNNIDQIINSKTIKAFELLGKSLNASILKNNEKKYADMLAPHYLDGILRKYHVVLAQHVIDVSTTIEFEEANPSKKFRTGTFRREFFTNTEELWSTLRNKIFDNINDNERRTYESELYTFKLPHIFGNIDLAVSDKERIGWLAENFDKIFKAHYKTNVITVNETFCRDNKLNNGFVGINGGMESLLGNLLVYDGVTKMLKFNEEFITRDLVEKKHTNSEKLFMELQKRAKENYDLFSFRFDIQITDFTKLSIDASESEKQSIREYLNLLYFFTNQAKENEVEDTLKREIENKNKFGKGNQMLLRVHTDAIFLKFHDEVQKWWMSVGEADYLTLTCDFYAKTRNDIIDSPMLTVLNFVYINKINKSLITFNEDAMSSLDLDKDDHFVIINTKNVFLTAIKAYQHFKCKAHDYITFIDVKYIVDEKYYSSVLSEVEKSNIKYFVLIHKNNEYFEYMERLVSAIQETSSNKKIILITEDLMPECNLLHQMNVLEIKEDRKIDLIDIDNYGTFTKNWTVLFQGRETTVDRILDDEAKYFVGSDVLTKILRKECVAIGKSIENSRYEEVKKYCINRSLIRNQLFSYTHYPVNTFNDIDDNVVLIAAEPGMGKSTFLNQVSEQTKNIEDSSGTKSTWMVNINLIDYCREFKYWKQNSVDLDYNQVLTFICIAAVNTLKSTPNRKDKSEKFRISSEDLNLVTFDVDCITRLELKLFIHYYKHGNVVLMFDGFDEICPHYEYVVFRLLHILVSKFTIDYKERKLQSSSNEELSSRNQIKIWITTRPYKNIKNSLETKLKLKAYRLLHLSKEQQTQYLKNYLSDNLNLTPSNLEEATNFYFHNIVTALEGDSVNIVDRLFDIVANDFLNFLVNDRYNKYSNRLLDNFNDRLTSLSSIPLHLYIAAEYYISQIRDGQNLKWYKERKTINFFEYFLEIKFKKIRFEEKRQVDVNNPDNEMSYNLEYKDFIDKHKKIALCAIFRNHEFELENFIISREELIKTRELISKIDTGVEKTGVVYNVVDGVPRFIHMLFAEYFAVEYICDSLCNNELYPNVDDIWYFILNVVINESSGGVRTFFDRKIANDSNFYDFIHRSSNKRIVFKLLMKQIYFRTSFDVVTEEECLNILYYFVECIEVSLNPENLDRFLRFIRQTFVYLSVHNTHMNILNRLWRCIQEVNLVNRLDLSYFLVVVPGLNIKGKIKK